jgi:hypothetical protein
MVEFVAIRDLAVGLPVVEEGTWYRSPAFRVRGRVFARLHENDPDLFLIKVGGDERDALVADHPGRFLLTDHPPEHADCVLMRLSATHEADLEEVAELIELAWRRIAPPGVASLLD